MSFNNRDNQEVQPGELKDIASFGELQEVSDGAGGREETLAEILNTRCALRAVKGAADTEGNREKGRVTVLLRIRYRTDVALKAEHQVTVRGVTYELTAAPQDRTGNRRTLWVEAVSV